MHFCTMTVVADGSAEYHQSLVFQDAFSLLAYSNPWSSPVGWQLDPIQRETVCAVLNSAILGECTHFVNKCRVGDHVERKVPKYG